MPEQRDEPLAQLFAAGAEAKAERQRALVATLHGRPAPARDEHGRYAKRDASFDGGARRASLRPRETHGEQVARMASMSRTYRGATFGERI